jgi:pimeloyl-ACP methyl ester carboxylesterase/DNA-binding CsgD family transcriptional regulator
MKEDRPHTAARLVAREDKAEIVDRLYDVALDPIRLEDLVDVWEGRVGPMRVGPVETATRLEDPEIDAHTARARVFLDRLDASWDAGDTRSVLDDIPRSAAFLSDGARLTECNRAAMTAFGVETGERLEGLPFHPDDIETLAGVIRKVIGRHGEKVMTLRIRSALTGGPVIMRVSQVEADRQGATARPVALVLSTELVWPEGFEETVQEAFGLTPAEVEIVRAITLGLPLKDIADARGRSLETVRTQVRSILAKTETHGQSELVRVVLGLMDVALIPAGARAPDGDGAGGVLAPRPFRHLTTPQGRNLDWIEFGDPKGAPVLFMHMDYGFIRWPAAAERLAEARGWRVVVPVRAGYGGTDPHPKGAVRLEAAAQDYMAVLDHLGLSGVHVISMGADFRFALRLAELRPGLVAGVIGCASQLPLRTAAQYDRMDKWQRFILANARYAPRVLPFLVQAGFSLARRVGKEAFFSQVNGGSAADMVAFARPDVRAAILAGSEVCLGAGTSAHEAFTAECIDSERDWSALVRQAKVPVVLFQADQDPQTPVQTIRELALDFPALDITFLPGTGQLLFFAEWRKVLDRLGEMIALARDPR